MAQHDFPDQEYGRRLLPNVDPQLMETTMNKEL